MANSKRLADLVRREAIQDVLYRAVIGIDRGDYDLFSSAFPVSPSAEPILEVLSRDVTVCGLSAIRELTFHRVGTSVATHMLSNIRVNLSESDGEDMKAKVTAYALAQHCPVGEVRGDRNYLVGSEYAFDMVREDADDEVWKIHKWTLKTIWRQGDASVMN